MRQAARAIVVVAVLGGAASAQEIGPIVHEGIVAAPVDEVWEAFSTTEGLGAWLAPHVEIDLRVGGLLRTNYDPAGSLGDPQTIENEILSFDPGRMLSIRTVTAPQGFPFPAAVLRMWTVVYFEAAGADQTRVREVSLGFGPDDESQQMRAFFQQGNATTLSELQRHFAAR